jgi:tetrahydromethanopterin S-methyltransferase subunit G
MTDEEKNLLIRIAERLENFEKRMDDKFEVINESLKRDYKILYGNGQPGLVQQVQDLTHARDEMKKQLDGLEKKLEALPGRIQTLENYHTNENSFLRKFGAIIAWLATTALALYSAIKHH